MTYDVILSPFLFKVAIPFAAAYTKIDDLGTQSTANNASLYNIIPSPAREQPRIRVARVIIYVYKVVSGAPRGSLSPAEATVKLNGQSMQ
jgi:hypothetical protein